MLAVDLLCQAVNDAAAEGYHVVSLSGGEPTLYPPLRTLLAHAQACNMLTAVTTNGTLFNEARLQALQGGTDLVAISLDDHPASHNRMRGSARAFERMQSNLAGLRETGIPFDFIFTLTQYNLAELDWAAHVARAQGASLLQIHPLAEVSRAARELAGEKPDTVETSIAYLEAARLQQALGDSLFIQVDAVHRQALTKQPERIYAAPDLPPQTTPLAELVSPLIMEADGTVVPLQYGFARSYALGNLHQAPLSELAATWRGDRLKAFRHLCQRVYDDQVRPAELSFFNWFEMISHASRQELGLS